MNPVKTTRKDVPSVTDMGCCGAYCASCREFLSTCKGCTKGYTDGSRDLSLAKCKIKICCISKGYICCADCPELEGCPLIQTFFAKGYKYSRYHASIEFIRSQGYEAFRQATASWTCAYGKLPKLP